MINKTNLFVNFINIMNKNQMKKYCNNLFQKKKNFQKMKIYKNNYNKLDMIMKVIYIELRIL